MIINYGLRSDSTFDFWQVYPIDDSLPKLEVEDPTIIKLGITKLIDGKIVQPVGYAENVEAKNNARFRMFRKSCFAAFDTWEKNVLRGREAEDETIQAWYQSMLDYPTQITDKTTRDDYPTIPEKIRYYLGG